MTKAKLILMVGLPFSGKTTRAKQLEKQYNAIRFTPDEWQKKLFGTDWQNNPNHDEHHTAIEKIMEGLAFDLLDRGHSVILDFGFWSAEERIFFRDKAKSAGWDFAICFCDCTEEELRKRLVKRNAEEGQFIIPWEKLCEWIPLFQKPTAIEGKLID